MGDLRVMNNENKSSAAAALISKKLIVLEDYQGVVLQVTDFLC
jgi:hypothetical protein